MWPRSRPEREVPRRDRPSSTGRFVAVSTRADILVCTWDDLGNVEHVVRVGPEARSSLQRVITVSLLAVRHPCGPNRCEMRCDSRRHVPVDRVDPRCEAAEKARAIAVLVRSVVLAAALISPELGCDRRTSPSPQESYRDSKARYDISGRADHDRQRSDTPVVGRREW